MGDDGKMGSETETTKWHWIVCFAVPFATILEAAVPHSFGTFVAYFQKNTNLPMVELIYITAIVSAAPLAFLPIFVPLVRQWNDHHRLVSFFAFLSIAGSSFLSSGMIVVHWLFLTYTFVYSLGSSVLLAVCIVILSEYFPVNHPHHILATSLYQIGYPLAAASFSPFVAFLIKKYSWQRAFQVIGSMQLVFGCATTLLFKPYERYAKNEDSTDGEDKPVHDDGKGEKKKEKEKEEEEEEEEEKCCKLVCCTKDDCRSRPQMTPWFLAKYLNYTCWFAMRSTLTPFLLYRGHPLTDAALIMTSYACGEISLCVTAAILSRYLRGKLLLIHFCGSLCLAVLLFLWIGLPLSIAVEHCIAFFIGISVQVTLSFGYPASAELLGLEMSKAWTITNIFAGLGVLTSPILGGLSFDSTSNFLVFFYISASFWLAQALLYTIVWIIIRYKKPSSLYEEIH